MSTDGPTLVAGELRGYRRFTVRSDGALLSTVHIGSPWDADLEVAGCAAGGRHDSPAAGCGCGLYGWFHPADATGAGDVVAVVAARGRTVLGEHGFRAEAARITAVAVRDPRRRAAVARRYPGAGMYRSAREMVGEFPPQPSSALGIDARVSRSTRYVRAATASWVIGVVACYLLVGVGGVRGPVVGALLVGSIVGWQVVLAWLVAQSHGGGNATPTRDSTGKWSEASSPGG